MHKQYAVPVSTEVYENHPEFTSIFTPHIHPQAIITDHASVQCQVDLHGETNVGAEFGNMNAHAGNFVALCAPNILPDRLAIVAYTIEYGFLHDNDTDNAADEESLLLKSKMLLQGLSPQEHTGTVPTELSEASRRKSEASAKISAGFSRLDPVFGKHVLSLWKDQIDSSHEVRLVKFASLDEYLAFRVVDVGAIWTLKIFAWGTGIEMTPDEERTTGAIEYAAYAALSLTNDLFSWAKEYQSHIEENGEVPLVNAVNIVMETEGITEAAAKAVVQAEVRAHEEQFCKLKEQYLALYSPSAAVIAWFQLLEHSMAGNFCWSLQVPRYHKIDRNPYRDHHKTYGSLGIRVLTPVVPELRGDENGTVDKVIKNGEERLLESPLRSTLKDETLLAPYNYITSLPSKNVRQILIKALNTWYRVPEESLLIIESVVNYLHNSSLLLDDIQDGSSLRRGKPAAHKIFGIGQTINTATYLMNEALCLVQMLSNAAVAVYSDEMRNLHLGQGYDLHWSHHSHIPKEEEYISMVDGKTGGLFRLIIRLMRTEATRNKNLDIDHFATLLGRYFQIRDDYQNLTSEEYTQSKGFCDDLDEGKISFPLIQAMQMSDSQVILSSILQTCRQQENISMELKSYLLEQIKASGALSRTKSLLQKLHSGLLRLLVDIERKADNTENWALRLIIMKLNIEDDKGAAEDIQTESEWKINQRLAWANSQKNGRPINHARFLKSMGGPTNEVKGVNSNGINGDNGIKNANGINGIKDTNGVNGVNGVNRVNSELVY